MGAGSERRTDQARAELVAADLAAEAAHHEFTIRAQRHIANGMLAMADVLDALHISRATWYRRLEALRDWEAARSTTPGDPNE